MSTGYGPTWKIVESYGATDPTSNPLLKISISSGGGDIGGTWDHTVTCKGTELYYGAIVRSYCVSSYRWNATTSVYQNISFGRYDVYGSTIDAASLNTFLTNMTAGDLLVLSTWDEPASNKGYFSQNLYDNFGAKLILNSWESRCMYLLVTVKGKKTPIYEKYAARYCVSTAATLWLG
jgi:hypothetical protein